MPSRRGPASPIEGSGTWIGPPIGEVASRKANTKGSTVLLVAFVALAGALVPIASGRLSALLDLRFRSLWLLAAAVALQFAAFAIPGDADAWRITAHVASFPVGLAFVWANRTIPGLWVIAVGAVLNGIAIAANGGVMPASASAVRTAGLEADPGRFVNSGVLADPNLLFLGDVFAIPASWPFANVFSVGDVLIAIGAAYSIHATCGSRLVPRRFHRVPTPSLATEAGSPSRSPSGRPNRPDR
jgi:hypothetical protein